LSLKATIACFGAVHNLLFGERNNPFLKFAKSLILFVFLSCSVWSHLCMRFQGLRPKGFCCNSFLSFKMNCSFLKVSALFQMSFNFPPFPEVLLPVIRLFKLSFVFRRKCINVFVSLNFVLLSKVRGKFTEKFLFLKLAFTALFLITFIHSFIVMAWFVLFFGSACDNGPSTCKYTVHYIKLQSSKFTMKNVILLHTHNLVMFVWHKTSLLSIWTTLYYVSCKDGMPYYWGNYIHFCHTFIHEYWDLP